MFATNQILEITGSLDACDNIRESELYIALDCAIKMSDCHFANPDTASKCVFQITSDGRYCIGWSVSDISEGWNEFPFDFDLGIITQIILQYLNKQEINKKVNYGEGAYCKGFIMRAIKESTDCEFDKIKDPYYGIVSIAPYTCFYSR